MKEIKYDIIDKVSSLPIMFFDDKHIRRMSSIENKSLSNTFDALKDEINEIGVIYYISINENKIHVLPNNISYKNMISNHNDINSYFKYDSLFYTDFETAKNYLPLLTMLKMFSDTIELNILEKNNDFMLDSGVLIKKTDLVDDLITKKAKIIEIVDYDFTASIEGIEYIFQIQNLELSTTIECLD